MRRSKCMISRIQFLRRYLFSGHNVTIGWPCRVTASAWQRNFPETKDWSASVTFVAEVRLTTQNNNQQTYYSNRVQLSAKG